MLTDARTLPPGHTLEAAVAVIGAGVAGITLARELAADGTSVLLLDSGGRRGGETDPSLLAGTSSGDTYFPLETTRVRGFAGTSNHWVDNGPFRARPLEPIELAGRDDVPDYPAWPVTRAELDPLYRRAHELFGLGAFDYDPQRWASPTLPEAPFVGARVRTSVFKLSRPDAWTARFDEVTNDPDIHLVLHATVGRIVTDDAGERVRELEVRLPGGATLTVRAPTVVLAAGGLENPRLLLASGGPGGRGIGNDHDLVGRYFMEHPQVRAGRLRFTDPDAVEALGLYQPHPSGEGADVQIHAKVSPTDAVLHEEHVLGSTFFLNPVSLARSTDAVRSFVTVGHARSWRPRNPDLGRHVANVLRHPAPVARTAWDVLRKRRHGEAEVIQLMAMAEQAPDRESRVRLGTTTDALGVPQLDLVWRTTARDRRTIRVGHLAVDAALRDAGLGHLEDALGDQRVAPELKGGWHHMGTTRMAADPTAGVVDHDGRVHGVANLYVAGSSIFPTGGYANPTLTIVAMTLRLASHLRGVVSAG